MKMNNILQNFEGKNIVVIGDVMLDKYLEGNVSRVSPEAPVPVASIEKEYYEPGGAGNVAANLSSLGANVSLFSFIGKDKEAEILKAILSSKNISHYLEEEGITTLKTRIIGKNQQLIRFDQEKTHEKKFSEQIKQILLDKINKADIIIISDYAKGAITKDLMDSLENYKSKIIIDPKPTNKALYKGAFLIKLNEKEAFEMSQTKNIFEAGKSLRAELDSHILITRGEKGMCLFSDKITEIPTYAKEVYDVSGAGDSVIASLALSIASDSSLEEAAIIANHAAGIAVEKKGTYAVSLRELKSRIMSEERKILDFEQLKKIVEDNKRKDRKIIWTNGCFDLLHIGHVNYLKEAKKLGDILIVGINSDESTRKIKGPERPIQSENERAEILSSLECIDYIIIFSESTSENYLKELKPHVYVKGGDYNINTMNQIERKILEDYGGKIEFISPQQGKSTSNIIERIKNNQASF